MAKPSLLAFAFAFALGSCAGCVGYEEGLTVPVRVVPSAEGPLGVVFSGDGTELVLDEVVVTVESVELVPCGEAAGHVHHAGLGSLLFPSRALAQHVHASPLVASGPASVRFSDEAIELPSVLQPAPGCYDRVIATLSSLVLRGHTGERSLEASSARRFEAQATLAPALELVPGDAPVVELSLAQANPFALLSTLPPDGDLFGDAVLAGIAAQTHARVLAGDQ